MMPEALTFDWLFAPARDTLHVTGKLLDWLVFRFLAHDYHVLATVSFALCLGGWLLCAVLVAIVMSHGRPLVLLSSLMAFLLPLAGAPYWVALSPYQQLEPAVAYHQLLPILGLFALALLCVTAAARWPQAVRLALAAVITAVFSLSYASGAFLLLAFGATLAGLAALCMRVEGRRPRSLLLFGGVILVTAGICVAVHIWVPLHTYRVNPVLTPRAGHDVTLPFQKEFWHFFFPLFDRAVLSRSIGWASNLRGVGVAVAVALPAFGLTFLVARGSFGSRDRSIAIVLVAVLVAVLGYAALVSYARADFGSGLFHRRHAVTAQAALYAHARFFYWWIAAILPFSIVAWGLMSERLLSRRAANVMVLVLVVLALSPKGHRPHDSIGYLGQWNYPLLYQRDARKVARRIDHESSRIREGNHAAAEKWRQAERLGATWVSRWGSPGTRSQTTH
jgi:hypothetical protein